MTTTYAIDPDRLKELESATIHAGHSTDLDEACAMDWAAYLSGAEVITDTPPCSDIRLARLVHGINDGIDDDEERTEKMRRVASLAVGTTGHEEKIGALLHRLSVARLRTIVLPLADAWADSIREEVVSAIEGACDALESDDAVARSAAESAARSAAESVAESATESAAESAWSAAWYAAESAAWSAAESARSAAESAAWSAAESAARSATESAPESVAESATESATESAWSAARYAARSAARSAAWSAEADLLIAELERFHEAVAS